MNKNVHPVATLFPLLEGKELIALAEDIRWNGLREPIKRWNDMIIDGRNRAKACELANAEPRYEDLTFASEAEVTKYIISLNLHRRHLDTSQRAMIAAKIANMSHGGDRRSDQDANLHLETSRAEAAQLMNVSTRSVASAKEVLDHGDEETIERVRDGKESVHKAAAKTKAARRSTAAPRGTEKISLDRTLDEKAAAAKRQRATTEEDREEDTSLEPETPEQSAAWDAFDAIEILWNLIENVDPKTAATNLKYDDELDDEHLAQREALTLAKRCMQWLTDFADSLRHVIPAEASAADDSSPSPVAATSAVEPAPAPAKPETPPADASPAPETPSEASAAPAPAKAPGLAERKRAIAAADAELAERVQSGEISLKQAERELTERAASAEVVLH